MYDTKRITINIKVQRVKSGLSVKEVAKRLGMTINGYYKYEKDATNIKLIKLIELANIFECKIEDFLVG